MNVKSFWITVVAVYVVSLGLGYLVHEVWLTPSYEAAAAAFRPKAEMDQLMWIMFVTGAVWSVIFSYIFVRGREGKGVMEGVRFGALMGVFYFLAESYGAYVVYPIPYSLALKWFLAGVATSIVLGVVASLVYKPSS
jgi:hypothetical protein